MKYYHTALKSHDNMNSHENVKCMYCEKNWNIALVSDISKWILPKEFSLCDILYAEIPWPAWYKKFIERANQWYSEYSDFLKSLAKIIELQKSEGKDIVILWPKVAVKWLPKADFYWEGILSHWSDATIIAYWLKISQKRSTEILQYLSEKYNHFWNFCCGYWHTADSFISKWKKAVLSDINPQCIWYIQNNIFK